MLSTEETLYDISALLLDHLLKKKRILDSRNPNLELPKEFLKKVSVTVGMSSAMVTASSQPWSASWLQP